MLNKKTSRKLLPMLVWVVVIAMLLSGCGQKASAPKDKVTMQFSWFHTAEFVGFYAADQLGYYAEANLDVTLLPGGPEVDPVKAVVDGTSQFGVNFGDAIIRARSAGQDVVAISSIYRKSPLVIMSLAESGIKTPKDLAGKTVGVTSMNMYTTWDIQFLALLKNEGVDKNSLTFVPIQEYHGAADLHTNRMVAITNSFSTNEPIQAKMDGDNINLIYFSDYGVVAYSNVIFTNAKLVADNPDLVKRFIQATLRGYQYAIEHPKEATAFTLKYDKTLDLAFQEATMDAQIPLLDTGDAPLGTMDESIWTYTQEILLDQGFLTSPMDLTKVYTNEFIPK